MIPNVRDREMETSGVSDTVHFGISQKDHTHVMSILRDTLYSDKILAVLREYGSNAWDAHKSVNKNNVPISVTLPTSMEPTLSIRDYGPGMSHETVFQVYTQYGASTKRSDDDTVGMLGIGAKSGFAYSDSFTVTSWFSGMKRVYVAVLDKSEKGTMNLLHEEDCGEETGVMIQIAVKQEDIGEFNRKAVELFRHFTPQPKINAELPKIPVGVTILKDGYVYINNDSYSRYDSYGQWTAVMGCVPYRINRDQFRGSTQLTSHLSNICGVLNFNIGDIQVNASREELKYSESTKLAIVSKINNLVDEFVQRTLLDITTGSGTFWEKRIRAQLFRRFNLVVPGKVADGLIDQFVDVEKTPDSFYLTSKKSKVIVKKLQIHENLRIVIRDDSRAISYYNLNDYDIVLRKNHKFTWEQVTKDFEEFISDHKLNGINTKKISEMEWDNPNGERQKTASTHKPKHVTFRMLNCDMQLSRSARWEFVENREPQADDIFIVLERFDSKYPRFYENLRADQSIFEALGKKFPEVYGYKSTEKKPIKDEDVVGVEYHTWRKNLNDTLFVEFKDEIEERMWTRVFQYTDRAAAKNLNVTLGPTHMITLALERHFEAVGTLRKKTNISFCVAIDTVINRTDEEDPKRKALEPLTIVDKFAKRYPLLYTHYQNITHLWGEHAAEWVKYIQMVDTLYP